MDCLFFNHIDEIPISVKRNKATIYVRQKSFDGKAVNEIAGKLKYLIKNYSNDLEIKIKIKSYGIEDMPTIITFEYVIYYALKNSNHIIYISFFPDNDSYYCYYLDNSLIGEYIRSNQSNSKARKQFITSFDSTITSITENHYRKRLKNDKNKGTAINTVYSELSYFLKHRVENYNFKENYCEAITELCTNVLDHTDSDCILSMECGSALLKGEGTKHHILSVVISNVSENLFFDKLKYQHETKEKEFELIDEALIYHKQFIESDCDYNKDRFYMVSAFQNKVSTRDGQNGSGGTGLLKTINNILGNTYADFCYLLSGKEVLFLKENKILPENGYIGFNTEHNYISAIPDEDMFSMSGMYFNGTLIHLMLVLDKEDKES